MSRATDLIAWWSGVVTRRAPIVLLVGLLAAGLSVWLTVTRLTFQSDRNELISSDLPWNRRFVEYQREFPGDDDLLVVVKVPDGAGGVDQARELVRDVAGRLEAEPQRVKAIQWGFDEAAASPAAIRTLPWDEFGDQLAEIESSRGLLAARDAGGFVASITGSLRESGDGTDAKDAVAGLKRLDDVVHVIERAFSGEDAGPAWLSLESGASRWHFLESEDEKLLFIKVRPNLVVEELDAMAPAVARVREILDGAKGRHPGVEAGLTGVPVVETDETTTSMDDSTRCSIISIVGIVVLLMLAHGGWRLTALGMATLLIGIAWSFGFLTLAIGHLQILSVAFISILLGLGIDYAIYLGTRYEVARHEFGPGPDGFRQALATTLRQTGPGTVTGAVTPALAFATTLLTDFKGMAEMGLIAGAGILLCLVAALTVFPALLRLCMSEPRDVPGRSVRGFGFFDARWVRPFVRARRSTVVVVGVLVAAAVPAMLTIRYDYNLIDLQAKGMASVDWQTAVFEHESQAVWSAASVVTSLDDARARTERFRALPSVSSVGGVGILFPPDEARKLAAMATARSKLEKALADPSEPAPPPAPAVVAGQLTALSAAIALSTPKQALESEPALKAALDALRQRLDRTAGLIRGLSQGLASERGAAMHRGFFAWQDSVRRRIRGALDPRPLTPLDLPDVFRADAVGRSGKLLVKIFPAGNLWEARRMETFLAELRTVDPDVTGPPVQVYQSALLIKDSYSWAGLYALLAVLAALWFDFRRFSDALFALLPVVLAFPITFAVMKLCGVDVNPANIIVLPLLFGIGVESGVHMLHRNRLHPEEQPPGLSAGTGKGVVLATLTTIMGFGSMLLAHHRGIQSLGFVVSTGMTSILILCLVLMPAVLALRNARSRGA